MFVCVYKIFPEISILYEKGIAQLRQLTYTLHETLYFCMLE